MAEAFFEIDCMHDCDDGIFFVIDDRDVFEDQCHNLDCLPDGYLAEVKAVIKDTSDEPYLALIAKFKADQVFRWSTEGY